MLRYGLYATGLITVAVTLVCVFARIPLSGLFGLSAEGRAIFADALFIMILPLIAFGFMRISMSYFYAQKRNLFANIITYGEPIIVAAVVFTLPAASGLTGIWLSAPVSQVSLALLALGFLLFLLKKEREGCRAEKTEPPGEENGNDRSSR